MSNSFLYRALVARDVSCQKHILDIVHKHTIAPHSHVAAISEMLRTRLAILQFSNGFMKDPIDRAHVICVFLALIPSVLVEVCNHPSGPTPPEIQQSLKTTFEFYGNAMATGKCHTPEIILDRAGRAAATGTVPRDVSEAIEAQKVIPNPVAIEEAKTI